MPGDPGDIYLYQIIAARHLDSWKHLPGVGHFPVCVASVLLVFYVGQCRFFRNLLSSPFPQYLGENSFGIYLMHVTLINSIGRPLMRTLMRATRSAKDAMGFKGALAMLFWISELVTRYVDHKSVELAKWFEQKCLQKDE
ncbi:hypothetical protein LTR10_018721 [Elasticomyces elasticus]|uniref:Acyltransferase 3 domain-containing protein n=1 Tax=Exophiala sideris TaxID=1016849 RepID=A0ABR0JAB4_9EURO|nr:hypothetical protein LTR10_018721 [Elasticomyces elasticus]KAK5026242.1 hypothetical protein LTS07_007767 [Exophiala sideris]KAK5032495.1 hypothetical protein LTR13_007318 [Exophiala sideris]KAK5059654.1 hypothetical protein LTR69_006243 [Exophiala sideris]KAK5178062.1 hypothetical protein LTR44_009368 [Eurotiomycetes sp. CCFEE 6388]